MKPALVLALEADLSVLYADADVAFLPDPLAPGPTQPALCRRGRSSRTAAMKRTCWGLSWSSTVSRSNPRPRLAVYYGDVGCSARALLPLHIKCEAPRRVLGGGRVCRNVRGGDQAALEAALAWIRGGDRSCSPPLLLFPNGMALRTLYDAPAPEALISFEVPPNVVAFHANYVVGASQKRAWLESLGLWFD